MWFFDKPTTPPRCPPGEHSWSPQVLVVSSTLTNGVENGKTPWKKGEISWSWVKHHQVFLRWSMLQFSGVYLGMLTCCTRKSKPHCSCLPCAWVSRGMVSFWGIHMHIWVKGTTWWRIIWKPPSWKIQSQISHTTNPYTYPCNIRSFTFHHFILSNNVSMTLITRPWN